MNTVPPREAFTAADGDWLALDLTAEVARIAEAMREQVLKRLRRRGIVLGLSGGIDFERVRGARRRGAWSQQGA